MHQLGKIFVSSFHTSYLFIQFRSTPPCQQDPPSTFTNYRQPSYQKQIHFHKVTQTSTSTTYNNRSIAHLSHHRSNNNPYQDSTNINNDSPHPRRPDSTQHSDLSPPVRRQSQQTPNHLPQSSHHRTTTFHNTCQFTLRPPLRPYVTSHQLLHTTTEQTETETPCPSLSSSPQMSSQTPPASPTSAPTTTSQ